MTCPPQLRAAQHADGRLLAVAMAAVLPCTRTRLGFSSCVNATRKLLLKLVLSLNPVVIMPCFLLAAGGCRAVFCRQPEPPGNSYDSDSTVNHTVTRRTRLRARPGKLKACSFPSRMAGWTTHTCCKMQPFQATRPYRLQYAAVNRQTSHKHCGYRKQQGPPWRMCITMCASTYRVPYVLIVRDIVDRVVCCHEIRVCETE